METKTLHEDLLKAVDQTKTLHSNLEKVTSHRDYSLVRDLVLRAHENLLRASRITARS